MKVGKYARSVSIVGVGCTPFTNFEDHPETKGMSEGEAFGYAALEAIADAGLEPRDIQYFYHGAANPFMIGDSLTPNMQVADWFGVRGIGSVHHSEACCTGYVAMQEAAMAIASGEFDVVLSGAVDLAASLPVVGAPGCFRRDFPLEEMLPSIPMVYDRAYGRPLDSAFGISFDNWINEYRWTYGLTDTDIDNALNGVAKSLRRASVMNPLGFYDADFDQVAAAQGMPNADAFLTSMFNPKVTQYLRVTGFETKCDGAAAIVMPPSPTRRPAPSAAPSRSTSSPASLLTRSTCSSSTTSLWPATSSCPRRSATSRAARPGSTLLTAASPLTATSPSTPTVAAATSVTPTVPPASPTSSRPSSRCAARLAPPR